MTRVELLVVLAILATLTTTVAVSSVGMKDRQNVARTTREGESICAALVAAEGLSYASDFGRIPETVAELKTLLTREFLARVTVEVDGEIHTTTETKRLPLYAELTSPLVPTNAMAGLTADVRARAQAVATQVGGKIALGGGWRGPYVTERFAETEDVLRDGFGGPWEYALADSTATLTSRGRDRTADSGEVDWADRDRTFSVRVNGSTVVIRAECPGSTAALSLHVFDVTPRLTIPPQVGRAPEVVLSGRYACATNALNVTLTGCAPGLHAYFIYAQDETATETWAARVQTLLVVNGNNAFDMTRLKQ